MGNMKILDLLKDIVAVDSITGTAKEQKVEQFLIKHLQGMDYFKTHTEQTALSAVPGDSFGRAVVYGLVQGKSKKTIILINHHDVVDIDCYDKLKDIACDMDAVTEALKQMELDPEAAADFASGDWMGGRGSNDMKGGMAAQLVYLEEYSHNPDKGSLLFLSVPDEESFSCGMRHAISVLQELKEKYGLEYVLCINSEPNRREEGVQVVPTGSVGKLLPFVILQGKSTHISEYVHGLSPMGILAGLVAATEGNPEYKEYSGEESTIAPVWLRMRDCKQIYDFSLPDRAVGYCSIQTFQKGPQEIIDAFQKDLEQVLQRFYNLYPEAPKMPIISSKELLERANQVAGFAEWNQKALEELRKRIFEAGHSYPEETLTYVLEVLDFMHYTEPVAILGFAPPYYPATNSLLMDRPYFASLQATLAKVMPVKYEPYFLGVSDCSYCGLTTKDNPDDYKNNTPLWGKLYSFDMRTLAGLQVPFMLLGPWGKNLHEITERVNIPSLTEELPKALDAVINAAWEI